MESTKGSYNAAVLKFILFSGIGVIMFFVNVNIGGVSVIPIQHIINLIKKTCGPVIPYFTLLMVMAGGIMPIVNGSYKTSKFNFVFTAIKLLGTVIGIMAVLLTNDLYKKGVYSAKESVIIATGFSTVSISFLIVIANTLGFMEHWTLYFFACFFVTFFVTAVTARIYPIAGIPNAYYEKKADSTMDYSEPLFKRAWHAGIRQARESKPLSHYLKEYYLGDAIKMSSAVTASILVIGLAGMLVAEYTPFFDAVGYLFYPVTWLLRLPEPMLAAKAAAIEIAEMFLPSMLVVKSDMVTKFTIAVTSVSAILFFSASIPCLLSTDIPVKMKDIFLIWFERTVLSLIMAAAIGFIFF